MKKLRLFLVSLMCGIALSCFDDAGGGGEMFNISEVPVDDSFNSVLVYESVNSISLLNGGRMEVIRNDDGISVFDSLVKGPGNISVDQSVIRGLEDETMSIRIDGVIADHVFIRSRTKITLFEGEGEEKILLIAGSNWSTEFTAQESELIKELLSDLKKRGDVYLLEYTVGMPIIRKAEEFSAEIERLTGRTNFDLAVGISQGSQVYNAMAALNGVTSKRAIMLVPPNDGILPNYEDVVRGLTVDVRVMTLAQKLCPEVLDMQKGSSFYNAIQPWLNHRPLDEGYNTLAINTLLTRSDLLIGNDSSHSFTGQRNRVTIASESLCHMNMDGEGREIIRKAVRDILDGCAGGDYFHGRNGSISASAIINGIPFTRNEYGEYVSGILDGEIRIDPSTGRIFIGNTAIGDFDSIGPDGTIEGYRARILLEAPREMRSELERQYPGLEVSAITLSVEDRKVAGRIALKYKSGNMLMFFVGTLLYDNGGLTLDLRADGSRMVSYTGDMAIIWRIDELSIRSVNGVIGGRINIGFAERISMDLRGLISSIDPENAYGAATGFVEEHFENFISSSIKGMFQTNSMPEPFRDFCDILIDNFVRNNVRVVEEANVDLSGSLFLALENGIVRIDARAGAELDAKIALQLFTIDVVSLKGDGGISGRLKSDNLGEYMELRLEGDFSAGAHILFLPIANGSVEASAEVRLNFTTEQPRGWAALSYRGEFGVILPTIISEEGEIRITQHGADRFILDLRREYWDLFRDITIKGNLHCNVPVDTELVNITSHDLMATGRVATFFTAESQRVYPTAGLRSITIPRVNLQAWSEGSVDLGCGRVQLWKVLLGETWMEEMTLAW